MPRTQNYRQAPAARLVDIDPSVTDRVEQALADDPLSRPAERILEPISLGALVVSIVSLGWTVYRDIKKDRATTRLDQAEKIRRLTKQLREAEQEDGREPADLTPQQRTQIISVIAAEIVASDPG